MVVAVRHRAQAVLVALAAMVRMALPGATDKAGVVVKGPARRALASAARRAAVPVVVTIRPIKAAVAAVAAVASMAAAVVRKRNRRLRTVRAVLAADHLIRLGCHHFIPLVLDARWAIQAMQTGRHILRLAAQAGKAQPAFH